MLIWSGWGLLVFIILLLNSMIGEFLINHITSNNHFYQQHYWTYPVTMIISGIMCWFLGRYLNRSKGKVYIDKDTGEEVIIKRKRHSLFFINIEYWSIILTVIAIVLLFKK